MAQPLEPQISGTPQPHELRAILELACLAPSVHNTQPWLWHVEGGRVTLHADQSRKLQVEDACGRNLTISCGAALHHFHVAARAMGWETTVRRLPKGAESSVLAEIDLQPGYRGLIGDDSVESIRRRSTDRRRFTAWPIPSGLLAELADRAEQWGTKAHVVLDGSSRLALDVAVSRALELQQLDRAAAEEQRTWIDRGPREGIPRHVVPAASSVLTGRRSRFEDGLLDDVRRDIDSSDGLILLGGASDDVAGWLRTGEGLSALWLLATENDLSVVPLSQPMEVDETRRVIHQAVLGATMAPHLLVRIGWQAIGRRDLLRTPRRHLDEVLIG